MHEPALLQSKLTFYVAFQFLIFRLLFQNSFRRTGLFCGSEDGHGSPVPIPKYIDSKAFGLSGEGLGWGK